MQTTKTVVTYPVLKAQATTYSRHLKKILAWTLLFCGIRMGLSFCVDQEFFQPVLAFVYEYLPNVPLLLILQLICCLLAAGTVYFAFQAFRYNRQLRLREYPKGVPASLSQQVIEDANSRLDALRAACDRYDPFPAQRCPVRVQYLTPLSSSQKKDYLLEWSYDDTAVIPLGSSQAIHLRIEDGRPVIVGVTNVGTDAKPYYQESRYPLNEHEPMPLFRGEGSERRLLVAITYLGGNNT